MKDDTSQGKKSQREDTPFSNDEEDVDFEILDALEQLENAGPPGEEDLSDDDQTMELTLDEEEITFGDDESGEGSGFRFDESVTAGLEEELLVEDSGFNLDESFGEDLAEDIQAATEDDSFGIDFEQEDIQFDEEVDLDLEESSFDTTSIETMAFNYDEQETGGIGMEAQEIDEAIGSGEYDLDLDSDDKSSPEEDDQSVEDELLASDTDISLDNEPHEEAEDVSIDLDLSRFDIENEEEEEFNVEVQEIDFGEGFTDLKTDIGLDEQSEIEHEREEVSDQDEESLPDSSTPEAEEVESADIEREEPSLPHEVIDEEEQDEDFIKSLEDIDIKLDEEMATVLETQENVDEESLPEDSSAEDREQFDLAGDEDVETEEMVQEISEEQILTESTEELLEETSDQEEGISERPSEAEEESEEQEMPIEQQLSDREFLELTLRLSDEQLQEFEIKINEAQTLQQYLDGLEEHQNEIKDIIYHKLREEYIARKTVIFQSDTFTSLFTDVGQDLQEILVKRTDIVATVERLNEELEEIKVRHLVGEYNDITLTEKEASQKTEIALWNKKTEKIEGFISRYQESLDAEMELNPLRQEQEIREAPSSEEPPAPIETPEELEAAVSAEKSEMSGSAEEIELENISEELETATIQEEPESDEFLAESEIMEERPPEEMSEDTEEESGIEELFAIGEDIDEFDSEFSMDSDFESGEFELDDLSGLEEEEEQGEELTASYEVEAFAEETEAEEGPEAATIACKKCERQTPADQKFCVHCGGKAQ